MSFYYFVLFALEISLLLLKTLILVCITLYILNNTSNTSNPLRIPLFLLAIQLFNFSITAIHVSNINTQTFKKRNYLFCKTNTAYIGFKLGCSLTSCPPFPIFVTYRNFIKNRISASFINVSPANVTSGIYIFFKYLRFYDFLIMIHFPNTSVNFSIRTQLRMELLYISLAKTGKIIMIGFFSFSS